MASLGDTITYTYGDGTVVSEDVSNIDTAVVEYCDAPGGISNNGPGGSGGRVENAELDLSGQDTLYIWVGGSQNSSQNGRYGDGNEAGSSEISISNTNTSDSADEPFLVAAGGGGGGSVGSNTGGSGGARGGDYGSGFFSDGDVAGGTAPPAGGVGGDGGAAETGGDGAGAIDDQNRGLVSGGATITGGGAAADTDGEVRISYQSPAPSTPANVQITDATVEDELTLDWDEVSGAVGYYVYRAESSGSSPADYTQVADVTTPPYTDSGLEDGERYYYRVSSHD